MKKKILMLISVFVVGLVGMVTNGRTIYAQETSGLEQEYSYLLTEDAIIGQMESETRGAYLSTNVNKLRIVPTTSL